jgi:ABC-type glycerol-3-phosphate transport system permease component
VLKTSPLARWATYVLLAFCSLLFLSPLVYIFLNSFKPAGEIFQVPQSILPRQWTLENYVSLLRSGVGDFLVNSLFITVFGVILVALLSSLAGYGFARLPFPGANLVLMCIVAMLTIPLVIFLVPMFLMENTLGLLNTKVGLLLPNVAVALPFAILIMRAAFMGIPKEVEESAIMDGATVLKRWWLVMLPMARNGVVLVVIMTAYGIWGEYTMAKALAINPPAMPLSVGLTLQKGEVWQYGTLAAVIVVAMLPPLIIFVIFQRHIVAGVAQGAVKG